MARRSQITTAKILAGAQTHFTHRSYADVTMDEIAATCELTKGALYHHFRSKEELYLAMLHRDLEEKAELFRTASAPPGSCRERLRRLTRAFFDLPPERQELSKLVRRDSNIFSGEKRAKLVHAYQASLPEHVENVIRDGIESAELAPADPRLLAWSYVALVEVTLSGHAQRVLPSNAAKLDYIEKLFFGGCAAPEGNRQASPGGTSDMSTQVFHEWRDKSLDDILLECRDLVEDDSFITVKRWREAGGKVLGHFQVYFPEEIVHAAGMLPFKVRGASLEPTEADSHFGSYLCSILKTSLELVLSGRVTLDMFVTHPICDAARNLAPIWGRNFSYPCQILYLPQNPNSGHSITYLRAEYARLLRTVEEVAGRKIGDDDLRRSIAVFNENRRLLRDLYDIKRDTPWLISAEDAYSLVSVGGMIPREEHNELLRAVLPQLKERKIKPEDRMRVVFEGGFCEQPPLDLVRMLGRSCYVVDDDFLIGLRWITEDVPTTDDPLHNLAEAYVEKSSYSPVQHDLRKPKEKMLLERVDRAKANAVIVSAAKMCEPGLEEQVAYTQALEERGLPYFVSEFEENMTSFAQLEMQLDTFMENLLFG